MASWKMHILAVAAGISEFVVVGILFLIACFSFGGYLLIQSLAMFGIKGGSVATAQLILGIGAVLGFIIGLSASVSAFERKRWILSVLGPLTTAYWGILMCFYTLLAIQDPGDAFVGMTVGYTVILLSVISGLLLVISRREFQARRIPVD